MLKRSFIKGLVVLSMLLMAGCQADHEHKSRVLIIGDSISLGYTPFVEKALSGKAIVVHSAGNSQDSSNGVKNLDAWIGSGNWDVISFNFGLWDLCYRRPGPVTQENRDKLNGSIAVPLDEYERNLNLIATRLKSTGAKIIFQSITVVPEQEPGRNSDDVAKYNGAAANVMRLHGIPVNDLQSASEKLPDDLRESSGDVHYTEKGYEEIAKSVTESIRSEL